MKHFKLLAVLLFSLVISFYSCNDNTKAPKQETIKPLKIVDSTTLPIAAIPNPTTLEPAQNARGVWHYTCSIGCPGGAGSAVNCDNCGNLLAHNTAYHANTNSTPTSSAPFATVSPAAVEPSKNAAGIWHYTCGKGCVGGSGTAGDCSTCGTALNHNTAYHQ